MVDDPVAEQAADSDGDQEDRQSGSSQRWARAAVVGEQDRAPVQTDALCEGEHEGHGAENDEPTRPPRQQRR
jgi:hypothetical protein